MCLKRPLYSDFVCSKYASIYIVTFVWGKYASACIVALYVEDIREHFLLSNTFYQRTHSIEQRICMQKIYTSKRLRCKHAIKRPTNTIKRPTIAIKRPTSTIKRPIYTIKRPDNTTKRPTNTKKRPDNTEKSTASAGTLKSPLYVSLRYVFPLYVS